MIAASQACWESNRARATPRLRPSRSRKTRHETTCPSPRTCDCSSATTWETHLNEKCVSRIFAYLGLIVLDWNARDVEIGRIGLRQLVKVIGVFRCTSKCHLQAAVEQRIQGHFGTIVTLKHDKAVTLAMAQVRVDNRLNGLLSDKCEDEKSNNTLAEMIAPNGLQSVCRCVSVVVAFKTDQN